MRGFAAMNRFVLSHRHAASECGTAYAAWRGFESPLRHGHTLATCPSDPATAGSQHLLIWTVEAATKGEAMDLLPPWVKERTEVRRVAEVLIP
jgi:hypothetical protein